MIPSNLFVQNFESKSPSTVSVVRISFLEGNGGTGVAELDFVRSKRGAYTESDEGRVDGGCDRLDEVVEGSWVEKVCKGKDLAGVSAEGRRGDWSG